VKSSLSTQGIDLLLKEDFEIHNMESQIEQDREELLEDRVAVEQELRVLDKINTDGAAGPSTDPKVAAERAKLLQLQERMRAHEAKLHHDEYMYDRTRGLLWLLGVTVLTVYCTGVLDGDKPLQP
jgi:hypothetical protein